MKKTFLLLATLLGLASCATKNTPAEESLNDMIERGLDRAVSQSLIMAHELEDKDATLPRTFIDDTLRTSDYHWWCSGFFPGVLWQLNEERGNEELKKYAEFYTDRVEPAKFKTDTHDLGFMIYCSFGQGYRITGNEHYLDVINTATNSLCTRFNENLGVIQSWGSSDRWKYPVIIDNMMNLEMLCFNSKKTGDEKFRKIAETHSQTTIKNHFREDYSTFHVVSYDPETNDVQCKNTAQGYADESAWARGQAWGLYGFTMMYRETGNELYLDQARKIANFIVHHPRLPENKIPYWDFDAPNIPNALRDASAGAVIASALIELSQLDKSEQANEWLEVAKTQLRTLSSDEYLAEEGTLGGFILKHSVGNIPSNSEVDVPLTYADYYYIEALLRLKKLISK